MKNAQVSRRPVKRKRTSAHRVRLKVFVGYADLPAFRHATAAIGEAVRNSGHQVELDPLLWRFAQLTNNHWREPSIRAALEADVVVLASSIADDVTSKLEAWIGEFLTVARGRKTTLVVISSPADAWTISIDHQPAGVGSVAQPARALPEHKLVA